MSDYAPKKLNPAISSIFDKNKPVRSSVVDEEVVNAMTTTLLIDASRKAMVHTLTDSTSAPPGDHSDLVHNLNALDIVAISAEMIEIESRDPAKLQPYYKRARNILLMADGKLDPASFKKAKQWSLAEALGEKEKFVTAGQPGDCEDPWYMTTPIINIVPCIIEGLDVWLQLLEGKSIDDLTSAERNGRYLTAWESRNAGLNFLASIIPADAAVATAKSVGYVAVRLPEVVENFIKQLKLSPEAEKRAFDVLVKIALKLNKALERARQNGMDENEQKQLRLRMLNDEKIAGKQISAISGPMPGEQLGRMGVIQNYKSIGVSSDMLDAEIDALKKVLRGFKGKHSKIEIGMRPRAADADRYDLVGIPTKPADSMVPPDVPNGGKLKHGLRIVDLPDGSRQLMTSDWDVAYVKIDGQLLNTNIEEDMDVFRKMQKSINEIYKKKYGSKVDIVNHADGLSGQTNSDPYIRKKASSVSGDDMCLITRVDGENVLFSKEKYNELEKMAGIKRDASGRVIGL